MSKQDQLLEKLRGNDLEALKLLFTRCCPILIDFCTIRLSSYRRGKELAEHLLFKWLVNNFAGATCPLFEWMALEADAACERAQADLD